MSKTAIDTNGRIWQVGDKVGYIDIALPKYKGEIINFININLASVKWDSPGPPTTGTEFLPNLRKL